MSVLQNIKPERHLLRQRLTVTGEKNTLYIGCVQITFMDLSASESLKSKKIMLGYTSEVCLKEIIGNIKRITNLKRANIDKDIRRFSMDANETTIFQRMNDEHKT